MPMAARADMERCSEASVRCAVMVEDARWHQSPNLEAEIQRAVVATFKSPFHSGQIQMFQGVQVHEVAVLLTDDGMIQELNHTHRGRNTPTNVLSFPALTEGFPSPPMPYLHWGDVALAYQSVEGEAAALQISMTAHLRHLVVHGVLHLMGYDHDTDTEAERMEALERLILRTLEP